MGQVQRWRKSIPGRGHSTYEGQGVEGGGILRLGRQVPAEQLCCRAGWEGKQQTFPGIMASFPEERC